MPSLRVVAGGRLSSVVARKYRAFASDPQLVLTLNCGSSSIKYQVLDMQNEEVQAQGLVDSIGKDQCMLIHKGADGNKTKTPLPGQGYDQVMTTILGDLKTMPAVAKSGLFGVGHRVVHGGTKLIESTHITSEIKQIIKDNISLAPLHNPANLRGIEMCEELLPDDVKNRQVACFDTAFHHTIPPFASMYAIPYELSMRLNVKRYGFHGLSHSYVAQRAAELLGIPSERCSFIIAHLGSGCSATAVRHGKSMDTTMGMTPLDGLVMGTRAGQLDPGVEEYLCHQLGMTIEQVTQILNKESGLLGVSGISNDMRTLIDHVEGRVESATPEQVRRAQLAIDVFVYRLCRHIAALTVALQTNCTALVFTGGIGENSAFIRRAVMKRLKFLRFYEDSPANDENGESTFGVITELDSPMMAMVVPTNEELQIARDTLKVLPSK